MIRTEQERLSAALKALKRGFVAVVGFSFAINLLMLSTPLYMLQVYDRVLTSRSIDTLILLTAIIGIALLTLGILEAVRTSLMVRMSSWLDRQLSGALLTASVVGTLRQGRDANVQGLRDLTTFRGFLTGPGIFPVMDAPWAPVYLGVIYLLHPVLGWIALGGAIALFIIAVVNELVTRSKLLASGSASIRALNQANAAVRNADVIEAMGFLPNLVERWHRENGKGLDYQASASHRSGMLTAASKFLRLALQTAMLGVGAYFAIAGEMTPGAMIAASILMGRALSPVEQAITSWKSAIAARNAYKRVREQLSTTPIRGLAMPMPAPAGEIRVENLSFAFPGTRKALLKNLNFKLNPGEMLGLIGPSGSGKTTLARVMLGNLQPMSGHARIDAMDAVEWEAEDRGKYVGYLPQDVELFGGSIRENIARMGQGEPDEVVSAARMAGVHELISRMPEGYDTQIGEGGMTLSGGERQRVALARALYGDPRFVVLDEPNASLDSEGEQSLIEALTTLKREKVTTVVIAHRPAVLQQVDKVMIIKDGVIQAFGPREQVFSQLSPTRPGSDGPAPASSSARVSSGLMRYE